MNQWHKSETGRSGDLFLSTVWFCEQDSHKSTKHNYFPSQCRPLTLAASTSQPCTPTSHAKVYLQSLSPSYAQTLCCFLWLPAAYVLRFSTSLSENNYPNRELIFLKLCDKMYWQYFHVMTGHKGLNIGNLNNGCAWDLKSCGSARYSDYSTFYYVMNHFMWISQYWFPLLICIQSPEENNLIEIV